MSKELLKESLELIQQQKEWIMAVPCETPLPAMPGVDWDWADELESKLRAAIDAQEHQQAATDKKDEKYKATWQKGIGMPSRMLQPAGDLTGQEIMARRVATEFQSSEDGVTHPWPSVSARFEAFARAVLEAQKGKV